MKAELIANGAPQDQIDEYATEKEPPKDCSIDELELAADENGDLPQVGGFILLGFPLNETSAAKLKENHIEFDKILYMNDVPGEGEEREPGVQIQERNEKINMHYDWAEALEKAAKFKAVAEEHVNGEIIAEINAGGTMEEVNHRILMDIDPFTLRVDTWERDPEKPLPRGEFGDYCPVAYVKENWLCKGVPENPELECTVFGKVYRFSGEKEIEEFKFNPAKFMVGLEGPSSLPVPPPPPKVMIVGQKGSGVTTQIDNLCKKYKIGSLNLK
jgi:YHS domain-containing protein